MLLLLIEYLSELARTDFTINDQVGSVNRPAKAANEPPSLKVLQLQNAKCNLGAKKQNCRFFHTKFTAKKQKCSLATFTHWLLMSFAAK